MLAIVYYPTSNLDKVNLIREKYDMNWRIISPHMTIVSPVSKLTGGQLCEEVEKVVYNVKPFSITLAGLIKTSDGCLFLPVKEGNGKIVDLHDELYSGILAPYLPTNYPFAPHITLGDFPEPNEKLLEKAYSEAHNMDLTITCKFDSLTVIKGDSVKPAEIVKVVKLGIYTG